MKSSRSIAIDFGNTRTKVAYFDSVRERSVLIEGLGKQVRAILPSLFYVEETDPPEQCPKEQLVSVSEGGEGFERRVFIGDQAQDKSQADPRGFIHRVKIDIHQPRPLRIRGRQKVDRVGLAACLFAHIKEFCEKKVFHGESIERCRLTVPADYPIAKRDKLVEAAQKAGFQECEVLSEPEAAAKHWLQSKGGDQGKYVIVCDVGGGTTDFAILGRENDQFVKYSEVAPRSIEQGGLHVDEAIWETFLETLLDNHDQEESYWRSISPIWLVWIRGLRENDDRPSSGVCTFQHEDVKHDLEWETIRKAEDSFNADIAGELKRFTEQCAEATGEEQIPVLLAGGGSCMPNLKETLEKAVLGEVHVWNDSEYATVLGAVERIEKAAPLPEEIEPEQETPETIAQEESLTNSEQQPTQMGIYSFIGDDGLEYGSASINELDNYLSEGRIDADTQIKEQGDNKWVTLGENSAWFYIFLPEFAKDPAVAKQMQGISGDKENFGDVYFQGNVPENKLHGARESYLPRHFKDGDLILLFDPTVFGGAREGFSITTQGICWRGADSPPVGISWEEMQDINSRPVEEEVGDETFKCGVVTLNDEDSLNCVFDQLAAEKLAELICTLRDLKVGKKDKPEISPKQVSEDGKQTAKKTAPLPEETEPEKEELETIAEGGSPTTPQPEAIELLPHSPENTQQPVPQQTPVQQPPVQQTIQGGVSSKSKVSAGLLGIFLGTLGIHNFYIGKTGTGIAQLLISLLSCGWLAIFVWIWSLIESIMLFCGKGVDGAGRPIVS